jgi:hypothetical protein
MSCALVPGQAILVGYFFKSPLILATRGGIANDEVHTHSSYLEDHPGLDMKHLDRRGFWVWEGEIFVDDGKNYFFEDTDCDIDWRGSWRPATIEDFAQFNLTIDPLLPLQWDDEPRMTPEQIRAEADKHDLWRRQQEDSDDRSGGVPAESSDSDGAVREA